MAEEDFNDKNKQSDPDKDFGLPKVDIKPIQQAEEITRKEMAPQEPEAISQKKAVAPVQTAAPVIKEPALESKPEKKKSNFSWIILLVLFLAFGIGAWYFFTSNQEPIVEQGLETNLEIEEPPFVEPTLKSEVEVPAEPLENIGLNEIRSRANLPRYFVVVGSFIDEDMAKDFSENLNQKDMKTYLIYPYGEIPFYRLAISQFETFDLAAKEINRVKGGFNENLWVLKY